MCSPTTSLDVLEQLEDTLRAPVIRGARHDVVLAQRLSEL
jgi:hypothetical protein